MYVNGMSHERKSAPYERKDAGEGSLHEEVKKAVEGMMTAFDEYKKTNDARLKEIEKKGVADPVTVEKLGKIEQTLAGFESINQKLTLAAEQAKSAEAAAKEQKDHIDKLELRLNRPRTAAGDAAEMKKRVNTWARGVFKATAMGSTAGLDEDERKVLAEVDAEHKAMSVANDTTGGFLAPAEYVGEIVKGVTEASPMRSIVRVRSTTQRSIHIPKRTGQFAAQRVSENGTRSETDGLRYGLMEINAPEMYALVDISQQNLEDSAFDLEGEIRMEAVEQFAVKEGQELVSGTGVNECQGILAATAGIGESISGAATAVTADGILGLYYGIKTAYARDARYLMNRLTLGSVRRLKDGNGQYLWMPGLAQGVPNSINGAPYVEMPDMPNEGAGAYPVAFGDFRRGYTLLDRVVMTMLRDPFTQATSGNIRFIFRKRLGGQVTLAEAMRLLKCAAA